MCLASSVNLLQLLFKSFLWFNDDSINQKSVVGVNYSFLFQVEMRQNGSCLLCKFILVFIVNLKHEMKFLNIYRESQYTQTLRQQWWQTEISHFTVIEVAFHLKIRIFFSSPYNKLFISTEGAAPLPWSPPCWTTIFLYSSQWSNEHLLQKHFAFFMFDSHCSFAHTESGEWVMGYFIDCSSQRHH